MVELNLQRKITDLRTVLISFNLHDVEGEKRFQVLDHPDILRYRYLKTIAQQVEQVDEEISFEGIYFINYTVDKTVYDSITEEMMVRYRETCFESDRKWVRELIFQPYELQHGYLSLGYGQFHGFYLDLDPDITTLDDALLDERIQTLVRGIEQDVVYDDSISIDWVGGEVYNFKYNTIKSICDDEVFLSKEDKLQRANDYLPEEIILDLRRQYGLIEEELNDETCREIHHRLSLLGVEV